MSKISVHIHTQDAPIGRERAKVLQAALEQVDRAISDYESTAPSNVQSNYPTEDFSKLSSSLDRLSKFALAAKQAISNFK